MEGMSRICTVQEDSISTETKKNLKSTLASSRVEEPYWIFNLNDSLVSRLY